MEATKLYAQLEKDFITSDMTDAWALYMSAVDDFLCDNFKERSMGLVCDFTPIITKVYTAVFPTNEVMQKIIDDDANDAMLFVHHPSTWDIRLAPEVFQQMERSLLEQFKERRISIYNLHVPLDNYGEHSTSLTLAKALKIIPEKPFAPYCGGLAGVFGKSESSTIQELKAVFENSVGHEIKLYDYGDNEIKDGIVAVVAGGGLDEGILKEVSDNKVNVFVTGITAITPFSEKTHAFAKENKISVLGGTHYSTEEFACISMVDYFKKLGLPSEYIEDKPVMEDM